MRSSICFRKSGAVHRLLWINESKAGIYLGHAGLREDFHVSYHQDGTRHFRMGDERVCGFKAAPIHTHEGVTHVTHGTIPLSGKWFTSANSFAIDEKTNNTIILDDSIFTGMNSLAYDFWLIGRSSEAQFVEIVGRMRNHRSPSRLIVESIAALDMFPSQKCGLTVWAS